MTSPRSDPRRDSAQLDAGLLTRFEDIFFPFEFPKCAQGSSNHPKGNEQHLTFEYQGESKPQVLRCGVGAVLTACFAAVPILTPYPQTDSMTVLLLHDAFAASSILMVY